MITTTELATGPMTAEGFRQAARQIESELKKLMVGQDEVIRLTVMALIAGGHVLLEGVPGIGKTMLVRSLASAIGVDFARVQFTPDLMPSDITGTHIVTEDDSGHRGFDFQRGPLFTNLLLADEINRATPKTQSALLEAMQERQVTVGNHTWHLARPFFVLATQNPIELEGTYPLPEAQLDRFFFKVIVPFPSAEQLVEIAKRTTGVEVPELQPVAQGHQLTAMSNLAREVPIAADVYDYAAAILLNTHPGNSGSPDHTKQFVQWGSSPRGLQTLASAARIRALLAGRYNVAKEDVAAVALPALRHRVFLNFEADSAGVSADDIVLAAIGAAGSPN